MAEKQRATHKLGNASVSNKKAEVVQTLKDIFGDSYQTISNFGLDWMLRIGCEPSSIKTTHQLLRSIGLSDKRIMEKITLLGSFEYTIRKNYEFLSKVGLTKKEIIASPQLLGLKLERLQSNYQCLCKIGLGAKIRKHSVLLYRNSATLEMNWRFLEGKGLNEGKILANPMLLASNLQTIEKHWSHLKNKGLTNEKIATNPQLLQMSCKTINTNYQNLRRYFEKDTIDVFAPLLCIPPSTINSNVAFLNYLGIDYTRYPLTCLSSPRKKRGKMAWLLRQMFDSEYYRENRGQAIRKVRTLVKSNPKVLVYSIAALERMKERWTSIIQEL